MKIKLNNVFVGNQDRALKFYTEVLGFVKKVDMPVGNYRWLTVISPESPDDVESVLEPNDNPAVNTFQKALFEQGIPLTALEVDNIQLEFERLKKWGWYFSPNQPRWVKPYQPSLTILALTSFKFTRSRHCGSTWHQADIQIFRAIPMMLSWRLSLGTVDAQPLARKREMRKIILSCIIFFVFFASYCSYGTEDKRNLSIIIQKVIDLPTFQEYLHPEVPGRVPLIILDSLIQSDLHISKFNQPLLILTYDEIEDRPYIEIKKTEL